ncbi:hypothetical protein [Allokutzneria albata]|uniref:Uncharacterized protein n=1 Tax=Allokutzneria albata TaxID=211114 RepID=A0A1G9ZA52_ALLAB|nr:hypothetical protein [Allokutzneria albata]SDN18388.1 hypothetical protein SAMN04489726_5381 [Allokutzneria albata]
MIIGDRIPYDFGKGVGQETAALTAKTWLNPGEAGVATFSCFGHVGSTVADTHRAPHVPFGEVHSMRPQQEWRPLPTSVVSEGRFLGDEWVHDPSFSVWAYASSPDAHAVRIADHLASGAGDSWLVITNRRIGVVIDNNRLGDVTEPAEDSFMISLWEVPLAAVTRFSPAPLGKQSTPEWAFRIGFNDSTLDIVLLNPQEMVEYVLAALR